MGRVANSLRTLSDEELETLEFGDTTTGTSGISGTQADVWLDEVRRDAEEQRHFEQVSEVFDDLVGPGTGDQLKIHKTTDHLSISATGTGEGAARTYSDMDKLNTVTVTISTGSNGDFYKGGIAVSKEAVMTSNVDLISLARHHVAEEAARDVDEQLRSNAVSAASNNVDNSGSGKLTPDALVDAMKNIEDNNFVPRWVVVSAGQVADLRKDSQFSNAAEFGDDQVIREGDIVNYMGVDLLVDNNITNDANNKAVMLGLDNQGRSVGSGLVWKERPNFDVVFDREQAEHRIFYDQAFKPVNIHGDALCTIQTA